MAYLNIDRARFKNVFWLYQDGIKTKSIIKNVIRIHLQIISLQSHHGSLYIQPYPYWLNEIIERVWVEYYKLCLEMFRHNSYIFECSSIQLSKTMPIFDWPSILAGCDRLAIGDWMSSEVKSQSWFKNFPFDRLL